MSFKKGDKVVYLHERGGGAVIDIQGEYFIVEDSETGFRGAVKELLRKCWTTCGRFSCEAYMTEVGCSFQLRRY